MVNDREIATWRALCGHRLKAMRDFRGFTQDQMAAKARLRFGRSNYSRWENGHREMPTDAAFRLCLALRMTPNYLLLGEVDDRMVQETDAKFCSDLLRRKHELGLIDMRSAPPPECQPP
jgi:transcriptional regulator with XRE-family HTH domain